jgi:hypothetical protein
MLIDMVASLVFSLRIKERFSPGQANGPRRGIARGGGFSSGSGIRATAVAPFARSVNEGFSAA